MSIKPAREDDRITVTCPACARASRTSRANIGKSARCKCGHTFLVAERHSRDCPTCGQENPGDAGRCVRCDADLVAATTLHHERPGRIDPTEYEIDQVRQDLDYKLRQRRRVHRVSLWLALVSLPLAAYGAYRWLWWQTSGSLPTSQEIQEDLKIWPLTARPAILRGRPLTAIPFTADASRGDKVLTLYLDDDERPVAICYEYFGVSEELTDDFYELAGPLADHEIKDAYTQLRNQIDWACYRFADRYLRGLSMFPADASNVSRDVKHPYKGDERMKHETCLWTHGRWQIERSRVAIFDRPADQPGATVQMWHNLIIVKGRDW